MQHLQLVSPGLERLWLSMGTRRGFAVWSCLPHTGVLCSVAGCICVYWPFWLLSQCLSEIIQNHWFYFPATCFCPCSRVVFDSITASQGSAGTFRQSCCGTGACCGLPCSQTFLPGYLLRELPLLGRLTPKTPACKGLQSGPARNFIHRYYSNLNFSSEKKPLEIESRKSRYFLPKIFIPKPCYQLWSTSNKLIQLS